MWNGHMGQQSASDFKRASAVFMHEAMAANYCLKRALMHRPIYRTRHSAR